MSDRLRVEQRAQNHILHRKWPAFLFVTLASLYVVQTWFLGRFPHIDEVAYKAAGFHFANEGVWAAPEEVGLVKSRVGVEEFWAAYPPVYTATFALVVKLAGMGWQVCSLFDAVIHVLLGWATIRFASALGGKGWAKWLPGTLVLPLGTVGRPDELAMVFGLVALSDIGSTRQSLRVECLRHGLGIGLAAATSPGVGFALALVITVNAVMAWERHKLWSVIVTGLVAGLTFSLLFGPVLLAHPGATDQFLAHARGYTADDKWTALLVAWRYGKWNLLCIGGLILTGGILVALGRRSGTRQLAGWWIGVTVATLWVLVSSPNRHPYLWFICPILLALTARSIQLTSGVSANSVTRGTIIVAAFAVALGSIPQFLDSIHLWSLPTEQTWRHNEPLVQSRIPPGSVVVTSTYWWSLAGRAEVLDVNFASPKNWDRATHVIQPGTRSGTVGKPVGLRPGLNEVVEQSFVVSCNELNQEPLAVAGYPLTNSAWGFGPFIWTRRTTE